MQMTVNHQISAARIDNAQEMDAFLARLPSAIAQQLRESIAHTGRSLPLREMRYHEETQRAFFFAFNEGRITCRIRNVPTEEKALLMWTRLAQGKSP
jgi:hypothetical protein